MHLLIFRDEDDYWASLTLGLVFVPMVLSLLLDHMVPWFKKQNNSMQQKTNHELYQDSKFIQFIESLPQWVKHFPMFQPIHNWFYMHKLLYCQNKMDQAVKELKEEKDYGNVENLAKQYKIGQEEYNRAFGQFQELKLFEAFGESSPQVIFSL